MLQHGLPHQLEPLRDLCLPGACRIFLGEPEFESPGLLGAARSTGTMYAYGGEGAGGREGGMFRRNKLGGVQIESRSSVALSSPPPPPPTTTTTAQPPPTRHFTTFARKTLSARFGALSLPLVISPQHGHLRTSDGGCTAWNSSSTSPPPPSAGSSRTSTEGATSASSLRRGKNDASSPNLPGNRRHTRLCVVRRAICGKRDGGGRCWWWRTV